MVIVEGRRVGCRRPAWSRARGELPWHRVGRSSRRWSARGLLETHKLSLGIAPRVNLRSRGNRGTSTARAITGTVAMSSARKHRHRATLGSLRRLAQQALDAPRAPRRASRRFVQDLCRRPPQSLGGRRRRRRQSARAASPAVRLETPVTVPVTLADHRHLAVARRRRRARRHRSSACDLSVIGEDRGVTPCPHRPPGGQSSVRPSTSTCCPSAPTVRRRRRGRASS